MPPIEIRIKRGTASYLAELNPVLDAGEPCLEIDTNKVKYGDGTTPWNLLAYASGDVQTVGENNDASGTNAAAAGGANNVVSGNNAFVGAGVGNTASAQKAFIGAGTNNTASGVNSGVVAGDGNTASGVNAAVVNGVDNVASGQNAVALGTHAVADKYGQVAIASGCFNTAGDAQVSLYNLRGQTISEESVVLAFDGVNSYDGEGISTAKRLELPIGVVRNFDIKVTAYDITDDLTAVWTIRGGIRRNLAGEVNFIGTPVIESAADAGWPSAAEIVVLATNEADVEPYTLAINANGAAGVTIYWHAAVLATQLKPKPPLTSDMFVEVRPTSAISTLSCSITGGGESLTPAFDPAIQDYYVYASTNGVNTYNLTINGTPFTGSIDVDKALHVTYGGQEYFIRVLPVDFPAASILEKNPGYRPGYYLCNPSQSGSGNWFIVYNENLVPVWYVRDDRYNGFCLHYGGTPNKLVFHRWSDPNVPRHAVTLGLNTMSVVGYSMKNESTNSNPFWECHESHVIAGPPNRKGNFISMTYAYGCGGTYMPGNGLYIQELTPDGQTVVWDWYSHDYFDISGYGDYFHANSIDVHPVTGDVLLSNRHPGGAFCIDYATKQVKWALQGKPCCTSTGTYQAVARSNMTQNTKWLSVFNDPYNGPAGNHDARWHPDVPPLTPGNEVISLFDDQTDYGPNARGVIYEIDLTNNRGIFRAHAYSPYGTAPAQGGFSLVKENDGSYSHVVTSYSQYPPVIEFNNGTSLDPNQNLVFRAAVPGNVHYRVPKLRLDQLDINYMRTTAGRTLTTP